MQLAAAGPKAGAEKAKATRAAARKMRGEGGGGVAAAVWTAVGVGTSLIAKPVDVPATGALQGRRDKAAARERMARLPDHGRHVAPQGLNRLPAGFSVRTVGVPAREAATAGVQGPAAQPVLSAARRQQPVHPLPLAAAQSRASPQEGALRTRGGTVPALTGEVQIQVGVLLEVAMRAGLDLDALVALTSPVMELGSGG
jgi:hypothetical protein